MEVDGMLDKSVWDSAARSREWWIAVDLPGRSGGELASSEVSGDNTLEGALLIGGLGATGGAGLGAVVGLLIPRWVRRWP